MVGYDDHTVIYSNERQVEEGNEDLTFCLSKIFMA